MALIFMFPHLHSIVKGSSLGGYSSSISTVHRNQKWNLLSVTPAGHEFLGESQQVCFRAAHQSPHLPEDKDRAVCSALQGTARGQGRTVHTGMRLKTQCSFSTDPPCDREQQPSLCNLKLLSCNNAGDPTLLIRVLGGLT